jgi:hypothetical protein
LAAELGWRVRFSAVDDSRTCERAKALHGKLLSVTDAPQLPLEDCDGSLCRCAHWRVPPTSEPRILAEDRAWE